MATQINDSKFCYTIFSKSNIDLIQKIQSRSIRCIYKLKWDAPLKWYLISKKSFLRARYLTKAIN